MKVKNKPVVESYSTRYPPPFKYYYYYSEVLRETYEYY